MKVGKRAAYGLDSGWDLLEKLRWETEELSKASRQNSVELFYRAFNAAITAWHITDWAWRDMSKEARLALQVDWDVNLDVENETGGQFRGEVRRRHRPVAICREIATASKHVEVTQNPAEEIDVVAYTRAEPVVDANGNEVVAGSGRVVVPGTTLKVQDADERKDLIEVLQEVIEFWTGLLETYAPRK